MGDKERSMSKNESVEVEVVEDGVVLADEECWVEVEFMSKSPPLRLRPESEPPERPVGQERTGRN
jgi:hypothetical protein